MKTIKEKAPTIVGAFAPQVFWSHRTKFFFLIILSYEYSTWRRKSKIPGTMKSKNHKRWYHRAACHSGCSSGYGPSG